MTRDETIQALASTTDLNEQIKLVAELDALDHAERLTVQASRSIDWADTVVRETMAPGRTLDRHTASSDWIGDADTSGGDYHNAIIAEAAMWFSRLDADVKADAHEYSEQAKGIAARTAGKYGEDADGARATFLEYVAFLNKKVLAASGLPQIQQVVDSFEKPSPTNLPADVFDNFAPPVHPINQPVDGAQTNSLGPGAEEAMGEGGPGEGRPSEHDEGQDPVSQPFNPPSSAKQGSLASVVGQPTLAIGYAYNLNDYLRAEAKREQDEAERVRQAGGAAPFVREAGSRSKDPDDDEGDSTEEGDKLDFLDPKGAKHTAKDGEDGTGEDDDSPSDVFKEAASTLPQVQQTMDAFERPGAQPLPQDVMFPIVQDWPEQIADYGRNAETQMGGTGTPSRHEGTHKQADMYGASDTPHEVPGGETPVSNSPATTPARSNSGNYNSGMAKGQADAAAGDAPDFMDNSSATSDYVQGYVQGYGTGPRSTNPQTVPSGMGGDNGQAQNAAEIAAHTEKPLSMAGMTVSAALVSVDVTEDPGFKLGYTYGRNWAPDRELPTLGSSGEEAGIYAGITDNPRYQREFVAAHRAQADDHPELSVRLRRHRQVTSHLARDDEGLTVKGLYVQGGTSVELDTLDPSASVDPQGATPFSGPGTVPELRDAPGTPAAPGGASPYNGAEPLSAPVVSDPAIQDLEATPATMGAPEGVDVSGESSLTSKSPQTMGSKMSPEAVAFRKRVQATKLAMRQRKEQ